MTHFHIGGGRLPPPASRSRNDDDGDYEPYYDDSDGDGGSEGGEEEGMYVPASRLPDSRKGREEEHRGQLNAEVRARVRASSVYWGEDALRWVGLSFRSGIVPGGRGFPSD